MEDIEARIRAALFLVSLLINNMPLMYGGPPPNRWRLLKAHVEVRRNPRRTGCMLLIVLGSHHVSTHPHSSRHNNTLLSPQECTYHCRSHISRWVSANTCSGSFFDTTQRRVEWWVWQDSVLVLLIWCNVSVRGSLQMLCTCYPRFVNIIYSLCTFARRLSSRSAQPCHSNALAPLLQ